MASLTSLTFSPTTTSSSLRLSLPLPGKLGKKLDASTDLSRRRLGAVNASQKSGDGSQSVAGHVSVCTNKHCRKAGSLDVVELFRSMAPPHVDVATTGCLGKCSTGPNIAISPGDLHVARCKEAAHVAHLLDRQCGARDPDTNLRAFHLFTRGTEAMSLGNAREAEKLCTEAIDMDPSGGLHNIYCLRSESRALLGEVQGALCDAREALRLKPAWPKALLREAQAHEAAGDFTQALQLYSHMAEVDSEFRRSKLYLRKRKALDLHRTAAFA